MTTDQAIQTGLLIAQTLIFLVSSISLFLTWRTLVSAHQTLIDTGDTLTETRKALIANTFSTRFNMYSWIFQPITEADVHGLEVYPEDYMDKATYASYNGNADKIRKYIYLTKLYVYLAFQDSMVRRDLPAPFGDEWFNEWLRLLVSDEVFKDVHGNLKKFYRQFAGKVEDTVAK